MFYRQISYGKSFYDLACNYEFWGKKVHQKHRRREMRVKDYLDSILS